MKVYSLLSLALLLCCVSLVACSDSAASEKKNSLVSLTKCLSKKLYERSALLAKRVFSLPKSTSNNSTASEEEEEEQQDDTDDFANFSLSAFVYNVALMPAVLPSIVYFGFLYSTKPDICFGEYVALAYVVPAIFKVFYGSLNFVLASMSSEESLFDNESYLPSYHYGPIDLFQLSCIHLAAFNQDDSSKITFLAATIGTTLFTALSPQKLVRFKSILAGAHFTALSYIEFKGDMHAFIAEARQFCNGLQNYIFGFVPTQLVIWVFDYIDTLLFAPYMYPSRTKLASSRKALFFMSLLSGLLYPLQGITNYDGENSLFSWDYTATSLKNISSASAVPKKNITADEQDESSAAVEAEEEDVAVHLAENEVVSAPSCNGAPTKPKSPPTSEGPSTKASSAGLFCALAMVPLMLLL